MSEQPWIDVKDRLPTEGSGAMEIRWKDGDTEEAIWLNGGFMRNPPVYSDIICEYYSVTHWRKLSQDVIPKCDK